MNQEARSKKHGRFVNFLFRNIGFTSMILYSLFMIPSFADAATYYAAVNGSDSNSGTITAPFRTIAKGLSVLNAGSILYIRGGTYPRINGNDMRIPTGTSWTDAPVVAVYPGERVTITGDSGFPAPSDQGQQEIKYLILDGFKFDAGGATGAYGWWGRAHHIRVQNCEIYGATQSGVGGWIGGGGGGFNEIVNCKIHDNGLGGDGSHGLYIEGNDNLFDRIEVYNNGSLGGGGNHDHGMQLYSSTGVPSRNIVRNSIFRNNNKDGYSFGLVVYGDSNQVYNNLMFGNTEGLYLSGGGHIVKNNIIYNNAGQITGSATFSNNLCGSSGTGCALAGNPLFVNAGANDFHLQSFSPAINAGSNLYSAGVTTDKDGVARPTSGSFEIGPYEFGGTSILSGDINGDRIVNSLDWSLMSAKWLTADANADLNKDGAVNSLDWSVMSGNWLKII